MAVKFVGAVARQLSDAQFLVLAEYAGGPKPFVAAGPLGNTRRGLVRHGLLVMGASASARGSAKRNGARFVRLSADGRRVLEQAIIMRGGVPVIASPTIQPKERTIHAEAERRRDPEPVHRIPADAV